MSRVDDEAEAPTLLGPPSPPSRPSHTTISSELRAGARIGRYELVSRLGAGAMGVVWSALDPQLDRRIAIKLVHPRLARTPEASSRLLREARAMAKLSHRAVVTVHDAGEVDGQLFLAMELVEGTTLGAMLRARTPDDLGDWRRWLALVLTAGEGLAAAHASGVLHRDFKPDNVLVDGTGRVCVGDFGLATLGEGGFTPVTSTAIDTSPSTELTTTGALIGTPAYMSPQQLRGEAIDARADQFSFCVAAWEALHGVRPFTVTSNALDAIPQLIEKIEAGEAGAHPVGTPIPIEVREVLLRGLVPDPQARWPDLPTLLAALSSAARRPPTSARTPPPSRSRLPYVIAVAIVLAASTAVLLAVRRDPTAAAPTPAAVVAPAPPVPRPMFGISLRTVIAISADGRKIALGSDRLEIRELDGPRSWALGTGGKDVGFVEFDGDELRFSYLLSQKIERWRYLHGDEVILDVAATTGRWVGRTVLGDLVFRNQDGRHEFAIAQPGHEQATWPANRFIEAVAISPDRRRVAYLDVARFEGRLIVRDLQDATELVSEPLDEPTALSWLDATTIVYATGASKQPRILAASIASGRFGPPTELYSSNRGWIGHLRGHDRSLFVTEIQPASRARMIDRSGLASSTSDLDTSKVGVALGWRSPAEFLTWNPETGRLDRRRPETTELTQVTLDGEPANATLAGDLVIVSLRRASGRETRAFSLTTGEPAWSHRDLRTLVVRCAGDLRPPCFAVRTESGRDQVVSIVPETGELGAKVIFEHPSGDVTSIDDIAVNEDGTRLMIAGNSPYLHEISPTGVELQRLQAPLATVRSVAYDPRGGLLIGGTLTRNRYQAGHLRDGVFEVLTQSDNDLLSFARPSPDGARVLVLARLYAPSMWRLDLPPPR